MANILKRYIITGGPGSGKSSLLEALREKGYLCFNETSRRIIREQLDCNGEMLPWKNLSAFTHKNYVLMLEDYHNASSGLNFYDRGLPDIPAYCALGNVMVDDLHQKAIDEIRYEKIAFICPPWEEIYVNDPERPESYEQSVRVYNLLMHAYKEAGYQLVEMPKDSVIKRIQFMEEYISRVNF